jgi:hypothetical protein
MTLKLDHLMSKDFKYKIGTVEASEQLLREVYIDLREKLKLWSAITHQTGQARMGYIGQHLVSVVTGYPGGKSGARGDDIRMEGGAVGEIKTCSRIDQLGRCNECGVRVAPQEQSCSACGSSVIVRLEDSKWLIGLRNDDEFAGVLDPKLYFLVLFDFKDFTSPDTIVASIWTVDPKAPGFSLCMIDYYLNIRSKSSSKAPFNLWPYSLKFELMKPLLIYQSEIWSDNSIHTAVFPSTSAGNETVLQSLESHASSRNLTVDKVLAVAKELGVQVPSAGSKRKLRALEAIRDHCAAVEMSNSDLCDIIAKALYLPDILPKRQSIPLKLKKQVLSLGLEE